MFINLVQPEPLDRQILERHHMFATPASEPQPVGLSSIEIDKYTEKAQFIKDIEVCSIVYSFVYHFLSFSCQWKNKNVALSVNANSKLATKYAT